MPLFAYGQQINAEELVQLGTVFYHKNKKRPFTGEALEFYSDGQQRTLMTFEKGLLKGKMINWFANGTKEVEGEIVGGLKEGVWRAWYENGQLAKEGHFVAGKEEGLFKWWYENGNVMKQGIFEAGEKRGNWEWFYENGGQKKAGILVGEKYDGGWKEWYDNGQLRMEGVYLQGEKVGEWLWWTPAGELSAHLNYSGMKKERLSSSKEYVTGQKNLQKKIEDGDYKGSLTAIDQLLDMHPAPSVNDKEYMQLFLQKAQVHAQFLNLEAAESHLLTHMGIPKYLMDGFLVVEEASALLTFIPSLEELPHARTQAGPHIVRSVIYNLVDQDQEVMRAVAQAMKVGKEAAWIDQWAMELYKVKSTRLEGYERLREVIEIRKTRELTRAEYLEVANVLLIVGAFEDAYALSADYMNQFGVDKDFLMVQLNRWMAVGEVGKMEELKQQLLKIDPKIFN